MRNLGNLSYSYTESQDVPIRTVKICLIGDPGTGKTTYVKRIMTGEYEHGYIPTMEVEVHSLKFRTADGPVRVKLWDIPGNEAPRGLRESYCEEADAFMMFFSYDFKEQDTYYKGARKWLEEAKKVLPNKRCLLVGNKVDAEKRFHCPDKVRWVSVKSGFNLYTVLEDLIGTRIIG